MTASGNNLLHSDAFGNGQLLATYSPSVSNWLYSLNDWLGTKRIVANPDGTVRETCYSLPFGDGLDCTGGSDPSERHFTGKERDQESGNDYFMARYYASNMGRFMSPDPGWLQARSADNPQSLNLYSYVKNNPLVLTDPTGMAAAGCIQATSTGGSSGKDNFGQLSPGTSPPCTAPAQRQAGAGRGKIIQGVEEFAIGGALVTAAVFGAGEATGAAMIISGVLGGEAGMAKGGIDVADGAGGITDKTAEDTNKGIDLATNPVAAASLPVLGPEAALKVGTIAGGVVGAEDLATPRISNLEAVSKASAAVDVGNAISTAKQMFNQAIDNIKAWISPTPVH